MIRKEKAERGQMEFVCLENMVPEDHLLREIEAAVNLDKIYVIVEDLYCADNGRPSTDPVVLFKMVLIQHLYGIPSLRRTAEEVRANIYYRWFIGSLLNENTPHFATLSYNFKHRFTESTTDPDCGVFHKGEHKRCFAYSAMTMCDKFGYIMGFTLNPGNVHDSVAFDGLFNKYILRNELIKYLVMDAGFKTPYKCKGEQCKNCTSRAKCTNNAKCEKTVTKHPWAEYIEMAEDVRYTFGMKELYGQRKETIDRVFADAKEKYGMRYTNYRGLSQVTKWVRLRTCLHKVCARLFGKFSC